MFDSFRQTLRDLMDRATPPEERRAGLARMKQTLVTARMGLDDLRAGVAATRTRLVAEQREQPSVEQRGLTDILAADNGDYGHAHGPT